MSHCQKYTPHQWKKGACRDCFNHIESHLESALDGLSIAERIAHLDRSNRCFSCEQENPVVRKIDTKLLEKFSYKDEVLPLPVNGAQHTVSGGGASSRAILSGNRDWRSSRSSSLYGPPDLCSIGVNSPPTPAQQRVLLGTKTSTPVTTVIKEDQSEDATIAPTMLTSSLASMTLSSTPVKSAPVTSFAPVSSPSTPSSTMRSLAQPTLLTPTSASSSSNGPRVIVEAPNKWVVLRAKLGEKERAEPVFAFVSSPDCTLPMGTIVRLVDFFTPVVGEYLDEQGEMLRADLDPDHLSHIHPHQVYSGNVIKLFTPAHVLHINVNEGERYFILSKPNVENCVFCVHSRSMTMGFAPYDIFYLKDFFGTPVKMTHYKPDYYSDFSTSEEEPEEEEARLKAEAEAEAKQKADAEAEAKAEQQARAQSLENAPKRIIQTQLPTRGEGRPNDIRTLSMNKKRAMLATATRLALANKPESTN